MVSVILHTWQRRDRKWAAEAMEEAEEELISILPQKSFTALLSMWSVDSTTESLIWQDRPVVLSRTGWMVLWMYLDGVQIQLPVGIDIPKAVSHLPKMASGSIVPPRAGDMVCIYAGQILRRGRGIIQSDCKA